MFQTTNQIYWLKKRSLVHCWQPMGTMPLVPEDISIVKRRMLRCSVLFNLFLQPFQKFGMLDPKTTGDHWDHRTQYLFTTKTFLTPLEYPKKKQARTSTSVESELTWGSGHFFGGSHDMGDPEMGKWDGLGFLKKLQKEIYGPGWSLILIPAMPVEFEYLLTRLESYEEKPV